MIRFYGGRVLTLKNGFQISNDEVWVENDKIVYVGKEKNSNNLIEFEREINLDGNLLMPSFKNAHTHSAMTFLRSFADDLPLQKWLYDKVFPLEGKLCSEDVYSLSKLAILEYLTSGISACFDMYYFPEAMAKASVEMGFRTVMTCGLNDFQESPEKLDEYYNKFNNYNDLISYKLGFHAEYTTSIEILKQIAKLSQKYAAPVFMHSSETEKEVKDCISKYSKTPTELFEGLGLFDFGGGAYHSVWVTDNDLEIYKNRGVFAIINAGSNCKLASGIADVSKMLKMGINLAIGTDGPASNNCLDMFREMFLITGLQKIKDKDASSTNADEILKMATVGSAKCMGLNDCDIIDIGKKADLIVVDLSRPNMQPINNITKNLVYSGSKENIKMTMVNGKILYENSKFLGMDILEIYKNTQNIIDRIRFN